MIYRSVLFVVEPIGPDYRTKDRPRPLWVGAETAEPASEGSIGKYAFRWSRSLEMGPDGPAHQVYRARLCARPDGAKCARSPERDAWEKWIADIAAPACESCPHMTMTWEDGR